MMSSEAGRYYTPDLYKADPASSHSSLDLDYNLASGLRNRNARECHHRQAPL